jgi:predicted ATPase
MNNSENISLRVKNFKTLKDVEIELKPLTFLFGPNGSGKSSFIQAVKFLSHNLNCIWNSFENAWFKEYHNYYKIDEYTDLLSFKDILNKDSLDDTIEIELKFSIELNPMDHYKDYETSENVPEFFSARLIDDEINKNFTVDGKENSDEFNSLNFEMNKKTSKQGGVRNFTVVFQFKEPSDHILPPLFKICYRDENKRELFTIYPLEFLPDKEDYYQYFNTEYRYFLNQDINDFFSGLFKHQEYLPFVSKKIKSYRIQKKPMKLFYEDLKRYLFYRANNSIWENLSYKEKKKYFYETIMTYDIFYFKIPKLVEDMLKHYRHIPTVRDIPKSFYQTQENKFYSNDYYGILFDLDDLTNEAKGYWYRDQSSSNKEEFEKWDSLLEFMNRYLKKFNLADSISTIKEKFGGYIVIKKILGSKETFINLASTSSGLQQLLPIIAASYHDDNEIRYNHRLLFIEQPELHLHPKLQSQLVDLFISKETREKNVIIETHSEHIIRKTQVLIAKKEINISDVAVYFFDYDKYTSVEKLGIDNKGLFLKNWPKGFFDEKMDLTIELLDAIKSRSN